MKNYLLIGLSIFAAAILANDFQAENDQKSLYGTDLSNTFRGRDLRAKSLEQIFTVREEDRSRAKIAKNVNFISKDEPETTTEEPHTLGAEEWAIGLASGLVITLCSVCGVLLIPITSKPWYDYLLLYLIATATSSLMGNSIFQLMPPAFGIDMSKWENIGRSTTVYVSFMAFFIIERILNIVFGEDDDEEGSVQGHENLANPEIRKSRANTNLSISSKTKEVRARAGSTMANLALSAAINADELPAHSDNNNKENLTLIEKMKQVKMVAWMLFIGDALENVADGLAMGAGFGSSIALGIGITIAIFSEEFPHKIGDFAIFLNAGMSTKMALIVNVISGATVWIGIVIGLLLGENEEATCYIFAIAAGVFLYVGLGGLFPEMGECSETLQEKGVNPWKTLAIELAGLSTGLLMMILLCAFSDDIERALT